MLLLWLFLGIGFYEIFMDERVLEMILMLVGGLDGIGSKESGFKSL